MPERESKFVPGSRGAGGLQRKTSAQAKRGIYSAASSKPFCGADPGGSGGRAQKMISVRELFPGGSGCRAQKMISMGEVRQPF